MSDDTEKAEPVAWLEQWIEREFAGHGRALRRQNDSPLDGEPWMSMAGAKELVRQAVALVIRHEEAAVAVAREKMDRPPRCDAQSEALREALQEIADLVDSEEGEPLDDAIRIADATLSKTKPAQGGTQIVCPKCKGEKKIEYTITHHGERNEFIRDDCNRCNGTGTISEAKPARGDAQGVRDIWHIQHSVPGDGFECYYLMREGKQVAEICGPQTDERARHLDDLVFAANGNAPNLSETKPAQGDGQELADWKQAAGVEAGLRREFLMRAEQAESTLRDIISIAKDANATDALGDIVQRAEEELGK